MLLSILFGVLTGLGQAIASSVIDTFQWNNRIFNQFNPEGYFGPRSITWKRKQSLAFKTILAPFRDIWHGGDTIRTIGYSGYIIYHAVVIYLLFTNYFQDQHFNVFSPIAYLLADLVTFPLLYEYVFVRLAKKPKYTLEELNKLRGK